MSFCQKIYFFNLIYISCGKDKKKQLATKILTPYFIKILTLSQGFVLQIFRKIR